MINRLQRTGVRPRHAAYLIVGFWMIWIVVFGLLEYLVDRDTFDTPWLGLWWAIQTVTTVGYGDVVPEQTVGRAMAAFLMLGGLSLLAVVTGAITSTFVAQAQAERVQAGDDPVMQKLGDVTAQLEEIKAELAHIREGSGAAE
jgi:voltage-gated potassium channel